MSRSVIVVAVSDHCRVSSARFHTDGIDGFGPGGRAVSNALDALVGDDFVVVEIERDDGRFSLVIDAEWVRFAQLIGDVDQDLVDAVELPRSILRAVITGWSDDWWQATDELEIHESADSIPHLRLASLRPSPTGATRRNPRS